MVLEVEGTDGGGAAFVGADGAGAAACTGFDSAGAAFGGAGFDGAGAFSAGPSVTASAQEDVLLVDQSSVVPHETSGAAAAGAVDAPLTGAPFCRGGREVL